MFRANDDGTYDLWVKGKIAEYDLDEDEFSFALSRARYTVETHGSVYVEDTTGHRERLRLRSR